MPDLPLNSTSPDVNFFSPSDDKPVATKPNWLSFSYALRHNRWLFLAQVSIILIILLVISLVGLLVYSQISKAVPSQEVTPTPNSTSEQPITTHNSDDDAFFADQPLTAVYYSYAQTTGSKNMLQATPNDRENRVLNIGYPDKYTFLTSPDGSWLLRWNERTIERAPAATPQKFTSVYELNDKELKINSVIWQSDSSTLAISANKIESNLETTPKVQIMILPLVTLQPVTVYEDSKELTINLVQFPTSTGLYFVENQNGSNRNLTLYNIQSKSIEKQFPSFNQDGLLDSLQFSADMRWAFRHTETEVIRYDVNTAKQSVLYTTDRHCDVGNPNQNSIAFATVSPSGNKLLVSETLTQCARQLRNRSGVPTPVPPTQQTTLFSIPDNKVETRVYNLDLPRLSSSSWSPKEDFAWLTIDTQHVYVAAIKDLEIFAIPSANRQVVTKERVFIVGWLQAQN